MHTTKKKLQIEYMAAGWATVMSHQVMDSDTVAED
jgi:hypothetical protein